MDVQTLLQGVRCAAHTLQLAILDALDEPDIAIIAKARVDCNVLRSQSFKAASQVAHIPVTDYVLALFPIQWETY